MPASDLSRPREVARVPLLAGTELAPLRVRCKANGGRFAPADTPSRLKSGGRRNVDRRCRNVHTTGLPAACGPDDSLFVEWICLAARRADR